MILTPELAGMLWGDRILITQAQRPPDSDVYGKTRLGTEFKIVAAATMEERSALYQIPYHPSIGGNRYCGLCSIGTMSYSYSQLPEPVTVGRYCSISSGLIFLDSHHPLEAVTSSIITFRPRNVLFDGLDNDELCRKVKWHVRNHKPWPSIGHDVWIGRDVTLSLGVKIGIGAVLAAKSVVTRDVEPYSVVGGNPARHIRYRIEDAALREDLALSDWWEHHPTDLMELGMENPRQFMANLRQARARGSLRRYTPTRYVFTQTGAERYQGSYGSY